MTPWKPLLQLPNASLAKMKLSLAFTSLALSGVTQSLCPFAERALGDREYLKRSLEQQVGQALAKEEEAPKGKRQSGPGGIPFTTFDPDQLVDVTGEYAWVAPGPGDLRGPCPGLNALANHGYFPHNGVVPLATGASATEQVYGE